VGVVACEQLGGQQRAADRQVDAVHGVAAERDADHRCEAPRAQPQRALDLPRLRARRQAAGVAQRVVRQPRVDRGEPLERRPHGSLADRQVGVARLRAPLVRGVTDAHRQPHADEVPEDRDLVLGERVRGVVAGRDGGRGGERVRRAEQRVGGCDRGLRRDDGVHHVAEVEQADDALVARQEIVAAAADQHVVVVGVVVDHAVAQRPEARQRRRREAVEQALDQRPPRVSRDLGEQRTDHRGGARDVPVELAVRGRVVERGERAVERAHEAAEVGEQRRRVRARRRERRARQPGQQPDVVAATVGARHALDLPAVAAGDHARARHAAAEPGRVRHRRVLRREHRLVLAGVRDLEHVARAAARVDAEVLVTLAGELMRPAVDAEQPRDEGGGLVGSEPWCVLHDRHPDAPSGIP